MADANRTTGRRAPARGDVTALQEAAEKERLREVQDGLPARVAAIEEYLTDIDAVILLAVQRNADEIRSALGIGSHVVLPVDELVKLVRRD